MNVGKKKNRTKPGRFLGRAFWLFDGDDADGAAAAAAKAQADADAAKKADDDKKAAEAAVNENKGGDDKDKKTELPEDVKARLKRLDELEAERAEDKRKADEKAEADRKAKLTADEREAERDKEIEAIKRNNAIFKMREKLGMVGGLYGELDPLVTGKTDEEIETSLKNLKEKIDAHVDDKVKAHTAKEGNGGGTTTIGNGGKPTGGASDKAKDQANMGKMPTDLATRFFGDEFKKA